MEASSGGGREEGIAGDGRAAGRGRKLGGKGAIAGNPEVEWWLSSVRVARKFGSGAGGEMGRRRKTRVGERVVSAREGS